MLGTYLPDPLLTQIPTPSDRDSFLSAPSEAPRTPTEPPPLESWKNRGIIVPVPCRRVVLHVFTPGSHTGRRPLRLTGARSAHVQEVVPQAHVGPSPVIFVSPEGLGCQSHCGPGLHLTGCLQCPTSHLRSHSPRTRSRKTTHQGVNHYRPNQYMVGREVEGLRVLSHTPSVSKGTIVSRVNLRRKGVSYRSILESHQKE